MRARAGHHVPMKNTTSELGGCAGASLRRLVHGQKPKSAYLFLASAASSRRASDRDSMEDYVAGARGASTRIKCAKEWCTAGAPLTSTAHQSPQRIQRLSEGIPKNEASFPKETRLFGKVQACRFIM